MDLVWTSVALIGQVLVNALTSPYFLLFLLALLLGIAWQYRRNARLSGNLQGGGWITSLRPALISTIFGMLGGFFGSLLLLQIGVDISRIAIIPLWISALFLMMINPRFLCFAYSGGLLALSSLLTGYPRLSIPDLMALIAILHMLESLLILMDGPFYPVPVYVQRENGVCGGFNLQKFWPVILAVMMQGDQVFSGPVPVLGGSVITASIATVLAVLGYGDISTVYTPGQKARRSSMLLFSFSTVLLLLAFLSARWISFQYLAAIFCPLGHELIIWIGLREEKRKTPLYTAAPGEVKILSLQAGSPAARMGLRSGDVIKEADDYSLYDSEDLRMLLDRNRMPVKIKGLRQGKPFYISLPFSPHPLRGIIPTPDRHASRVLLLPADNLFAAALRIFQQLRAAIQRHT